MPISEKGFPPAKLTVPESLHLGFAAVGAVLSSDRSLRRTLGAAANGAVGMEISSSLASGVIVVSKREGRFVES